MKKALFFGAAAAIAAGATMLLSRPRYTMDLWGKVILITGGSRGLGLAMAREFAARGSNLILCARNAEELESAKRDLAGAEGRIVTVLCDVRRREQVAELIRSAVSEFGHIDILINNAGVISVGPFDTMAVEDFENAMDVMFWGMVYTTLEALPHMRKGRDARIVNITSIGGKVSVPHLMPYSCAKFAAVAFSEGLGAELRASDVKVLTIAPGLMRTGSFLNASFKGAEKGEAAWFSISSSLPGISMSAKRAAKQIVCAIETGRSERILTLAATLLARFHALCPETSLAILGTVTRLLPHGSRQIAQAGKDSAILQKPWIRALTTLGRQAAAEYRESPRPV